jgi:hypothetical protein
VKAVQQRLLNLRVMIRLWHLNNLLPHKRYTHRHTLVYACILCLYCVDTVHVFMQIDSYSALCTYMYLCIHGYPDAYVHLL